MFLTLTCNLLAERTFEFPTWTPGKTHRAVAESFQVGGKGINVAKMLHRLGSPATALCFIGGAAGGECQAWLARQAFTSRAFATTTPTRTGTVVRDRSGTVRETTFLGPDIPVDAHAIRACADFLDTQPDGGILALCGSVPGWDESRYDRLRSALERWMTRGTLAVDTYGPPLRWAAERPVQLIKINADELRTLAGDRASGFPTSPRNWVISDGPRAVRTRDAASVEVTLTPPSVSEVSPTGSGDVLLAAVLHGLHVQRLTLRDAVAFAIPYAAANAAHPGVADFPLPLSSS
jgi:fructose-1-phosphate kinase PfkB-like protein